MQKTQKVVIMISVLLAPIFVFLFLKKFGSNEFELPIYYAEGNPIIDCEKEKGLHKIDLATTHKFGLELPILIYVASSSQNKYYSDLNNVLEKYPAVNVLELFITDSLISPEENLDIELPRSEYLNFINCELILGEDKTLTAPIANKYVLIDTERRIRGYYLVEDLDEIERLDVELDILLNYEGK